MATFLLREKNDGLAKVFLGVTSINIAAQSQTAIQSIVDHVVEKVRPRVKDATNTTSCLLEHCNEGVFTLHAPHWYLHTRGHDLEDAILLAYPGLKAHWRENDPGRLTATVLRTTADDHPRFIPRDFVNLFRDCMTQ